MSVAVSVHVMKECLSVYSYGYLLRARCTTTNQDLKAALVQQQLKLTALENSLHEREKALKAFEKALRTRKVDQDTLYKRCARKYIDVQTACIATKTYCAFAVFSVPHPHPPSYLGQLS